MTTARLRVFLVTLLAGVTSLATFGACVGDVASTPAGDLDAAARTDGTTSGDGTATDAPGGDASSGDAGAGDAGAGMDADDGATCNPSAPFGAIENVTEVNSAADDTWPRISADGKRLYFSRNTAGGNFYDTMDIYAALRSVPSGPFLAPALVANVNSSVGDVSPTVTALGDALYFDSYRSGTRHIFVSLGSGGAFNFQPATISSIINSTAEDYNPYDLPDDSAIYFSSSRGGASAASSNLWRAQNHISGGYDLPVEQATLNAYDKDESPVVTADDLTIFFATDRLADGGTSTYGSFDIYTSHRTAATLPWPTPVRVNEISSNNADYPGSITADACTIYFMSDRQDVTHSGRFDIYRATRGK